MELFDMVKAAPPPKTISATERTSPPSPIPPDSPDAIESADDDDDLLESIEINEKETDDEENADNNQKRNSTKRRIDLHSLAKQKSEKSSFKTPKNKQKYKKKKSNNLKIESDEEDEDYNNFKPLKTSRKSSSAKDKKNPGKCKFLDLEAGASEGTDDDSDGSSDGGGYPKYLTAPTKTKAQQKMFSDLLEQSSSSRHRCASASASEFHVREFSIRIQRLTQSEIDAASASVAKSKFGSSSETRKRGRPRKSGDDAQKSQQSPPKKRKTSPPKIHIKVPLQYGAKKRALANLARTHTPPPILSSRLKVKPKPKPKPKPRGPKASPTMVRRYGTRFFNCVVNVKKLKWPSKSPERNRPRPRRSNLSVSFNESVEILGSGSRRSTFGPISSKLPKPTRLQRVDATGNVLEDIALTSNMVFTGNSPSASGSRGRGKRRSCNGPQLKRPHQRIPLSGLARMRLDDGPNSDDDDDDDDEEYIVPNELPGKQRPGTPTPRKKKISYTTTISDDEEETAPPNPKKSKDGNALKKEPKTKPNQKKIEKSTSLKESVLENVLQGKTNEIVQKEVKIAAVGEDDQVSETEVQEIAEKTNAETKKPDKPQNGEKNPEDKSKSNLEENGENETVDESKAKQTDVYAGEMPALKLTEDSSQEKDDEAEQKDDKAEEKDDKAEEKDDKAEEEEDKVEQKDDKTQQKDDKAKQKDDKAEQKDDKAEEKNDEAEQKDDKTEEKDDKAEHKDDEAEEKDDKAEEKDDITQQKQYKAKQKEDKAQQKEVEGVEDFRELDTPLSQPLPPTTEENPDDVLEIQTSLEDVRQLHTPFSSQQSTPQAPKHVRRDSGDSDCSFKSAREPNKDILLGLVKPEGNEAAGEEDTVAEEDKSKIDPASMPPAVLTTTPPPSTPRTLNGCDPARTDGSIATVFYSPLEAMPTLDDEVLGQLVEPDFQLNSSRHAISRGALDDIMTALES